MKKYLSDEIESILDDKKRRGKLLKSVVCTHQELSKVYQKGIFSTYICLHCGIKNINRDNFE